MKKMAFLVVVMFALGIAGCGKKDEGKKEEVAKEQKEKKAEEKKEAPAVEEAAKEAPAEEAAAEEAPAKEAPAEEAAAEEAPAEEAPAEEAPAEEAAKPAAPAKLAELDLSKAYEEVPVIIMAPEGAQGKEEFGVVAVKAGDGFQLQVSTEDSNGLEALKKEHEANTINKLKRFLVDTPEAIVYESEVMGRAEFHFAAYVKLSDEKWVYCEDNKGPTYTQTQIEAMHAACMSAKASPVTEAPAE